MNVSEQIDLSALARREPKAIRSLIDNYSSRIFNVVISYLQNREDAEEITQDVFLSALNSIQGFRGKSSFTTWIYRIAVHKSLDYIKYRNRKKRFAKTVSLSRGQDKRIMHEPVEFSHPGIQLESKEQMKALFKAIN